MPNILTKLRWNAFVLWHARNERSLPYRPIEQIRAIQSRRVRAMIQHAYRNVPFYREAMDERGLKPGDFQTAADLPKLPIVEKETFLGQQHRFLAANAAREGLTLHSSGTSGTPKEVRQDARALFLAFAIGHRQRLVFAHFTGSPFRYRETRFACSSGARSFFRPFYQEYSWTPSRIDLSRQFLAPGDMSVEDTAAALNAFCPDLVSGYGSYLGSVFREMHDRNIPVHRPKLITYSADTMPESDRLFLERELGVPVISTYQTAEVLRIGFVCERRAGFHLSIDAAATRIIDDEDREVEPGESGHIVISNLMNRATVLLNYKLGDIVTRGNLPCPCGRTLPVIHNIRGRSGDLLRLTDGRVMHALLATEPLLAIPGIRQLQLVQQARDRFLLRTVAERGADKAHLTSLLSSALRRKVGDGVFVEVEWLDAIPPGPNGKVQAVISEID